ncbi:type 4a pilus biogenesis protein PilO [Clostridium sp. Mt-5]|uniref:Type 4a pilus biogenesis protein PilO n=1 Tax=Clostridium moutaii TaxID=3240932 RepID=A0ABV4BN18_9CLOT
MEKNKRDLMILIAILFIGFNYIIYNYFTSNKLKEIDKAKSTYISREDKLKNLKTVKKSIEGKREELKKLKQETSVFDSMVPSQIDTPQLIYDFYNKCKLSGVNGQKISFQLLKENNDNKSNGNFHTLIIDLQISGSKAGVENFIKNLSSTTRRKLNVKSISITSKGENENQEESSNTDTSALGGDGSTKPEDELFSEIIFYQYIQGDGSSKVETPDNYVFYDSRKQGFNSISDMFK